MMLRSNREILIDALRNVKIQWWVNWQEGGGGVIGMIEGFEEFL